MGVWVELWVDLGLKKLYNKVSILLSLGLIRLLRKVGR